MNPVLAIKYFLLGPSSTKNANEITANTPDNTTITTRNKSQYTYVPLTPQEERNNTVQFFVRPGAELTFKRGVAGYYDEDRKFRNTDGFVTHYLIEGVFTNSDNQDSSMSLYVPRNVVEREFVIK